MRVNDVRMAYAGSEDGEANLRVLMGGKAGAGRVTETAGVRGIDESDLKSAALNQAQLNAMIGNRVDAPAAAAYAARAGLAGDHRGVCRRGQGRPRSAGTSQRGNGVLDGATVAKSVSGLLGSLGVNVGSKVDTAAKVAPKSEDELAAEELALGPEIAGRMLGARPLWNDRRAHNGASTWSGAGSPRRRSRPDLPWTFGVIDTPEVNAFAAPGGYILVTRGLYELLSSDSELAAVLGHEISHCVQRDHYNVIRKQELATAGQGLGAAGRHAGNDSVAGSYARRYAEKNGAAIMLTSLDREAEYRADEAAEIYLARCRHESAGAVCGAAEDGRARQRVGSTGAALQDAPAAGCAHGSHRPARLWRARKRTPTRE